MKTICSCILLSLSTLFLAGCLSGEAGLDRFIAIADGQNSEPHEKVMLTYIEMAHNGDVDGLISLTSKPAIKNIGGEQTLRELCLNNTIPKLRLYSTMRPGGTSTFIRDEFGNFGWNFKRTFESADGETANYQFTIVRMDNTLVVAYTARWEKD